MLKRRKGERLGKVRFGGRGGQNSDSNDLKVKWGSRKGGVQTEDNAVECGQGISGNLLLLH